MLNVWRSSYAQLIGQETTLRVAVTQAGIRSHDLLIRRKDFTTEPRGFLQVNFVVLLLWFCLISLNVYAFAHSASASHYLKKILKAWEILNTRL